MLDFFWSQVFAPLAALPIETGVLGAVVACLGFMAGLYAGRRSQKPGRVPAWVSKRRQRKADEELADALTILPMPTKRLLKTFYEEGEVWGNIRDGKFKQLYQMGMIEGPPQFELLRGDAFVLTMRASKLLAEHGDEMFAGCDSDGSE